MSMNFLIGHLFATLGTGSWGLRVSSSGDVSAKCYSLASEFCSDDVCIYDCILTGS